VHNHSESKDEEQTLSRMTERNIKFRTHDDNDNLSLSHFKVMRSSLRHVSHCPPLLHELFDNPSSGKSFHPSERIDHSAELTFDDEDEDDDDGDDTNHDPIANLDNNENDRIVWRGHVNSSWNLSPDMQDKPSKPDLVSLTVSFFSFKYSPNCEESRNEK